MKKILFTGGGSAGHVVPNLALIDALKQPEETEAGMQAVLSRSDYGELMRQIRLEAD